MKRLFLLFLAHLLVFAEAYSEKTPVYQDDTLKAAEITDDVYYLQEGRQRFPVLGQFKQTYFITGIPVAEKVNKHNADIRFQLSLALRLARIDNVDLLGTYTESGVWNIYEKSSPLVENAFNPGLCAYWFVNPRLDMMFGIEHLSNGYVKEKSRSINTAYIGAVYSYSRNIMVGGKVWYGYYEHVPGLVHYFKRRGYSQFWATCKAFGNRLNVTALLNPSHRFRNYNLEFNVSYRFSDKGTVFPSVFVQYRHGYNETLLNFYKWESHVRAGFALHLKGGYNSSIH